MDNFNFIKEKSFDERVQLSQKILSRHPYKVPIIVETSNRHLKLSRNKFVVPNDIKMGQFIFTLRKYIDNITSDEALFLLCVNERDRHGILAPVASLIGECYDSFQTECGFLLIRVEKESTFGL